MLVTDKESIMNCKQLTTILTLVCVSPFVSAAILIDAERGEECPTGTVESPLGTGYISNGEFIPSTDFSKNPSIGFIEECIPFSGSSDASYHQETTISTQQITRTTSSTVNQHIMTEVFKAFSLEYFSKPINKGSASSDSNSYKPDTFWGESTISQITEESSNKNITDFDTDIYQFIGGIDKRQGDVFYGTALTYAYTENEVTGGADSTMHTVGVTPYVAYKINNYIFASGLASYYYSHTNNIAGGTDIDTHDYEIEGNMNAFKVIESFILKGRAGVRYKHTNSSAINGAAGRDNTFDELTWIADAEIDYRFDSGLTLLTGVLYEHYDREESGASTRLRDNIFLMRYGIDYPISESLTIGAKIENDLNDEDRDYFTGTVHVRLEL